MKNKILLLDNLVKKVEKLRKTKKVIVQTHGVFDLIHPGLIRHLNSAKQQGDVLIATVVKDKDVRMGMGSPIFPEQLRAENVASISQVDYVCIVDDENPFECVKRIQPDIFAKGQLYKDRDSIVHRKIFERSKELYFGKSKIYETDGYHASSADIVKKFLNIYSEDTRKFLKNFLKKYKYHDVLNAINNIQKMKIMIIGDGIIDEYHYCEALGRSAKAPILVNKYMNHEIFAGGAFAIANHMSGISDHVHLITLLGKDNSREDFLKDNINPNIHAKYFYREDGPTIVKKRYINQYLNQKLFEINYLNDNYINKGLEKKVLEYLNEVIKPYDIILISDFGHGFITKKIIDFIKRSGKLFAVNTQTNGANIGYNMITKYNSPTYVCLDEGEVRLSVQDRYSDIESIAKKLARQIGSNYFIVTRGKNGSFGINKKGEINRTPIFSTKVIDTVGAGDAFFAFTAPCVAQKVPLDMMSFIGNAVGALAVQIVGNKKPVEKYELLEFVHTLLK